MRFLKTVVVLCISAFCHGQQLDKWLTKEALHDPLLYLKNSKKLIPATPKEAAGKYFAIGKCYEFLNQEDIALKYLLLSKEYFEKLKDPESAIELSLEIHRLISSQENYDKYGDSFLKEYYAYAQKTRSNEKLANSYNEFGKDACDIYKDSGKKEHLDSTFTIFEKAVAYADKTSNSLIKSQVYRSISTIETYHGNFAKARNYLETSRKFIIQTGDAYELGANYINYGINYQIEKNYPQAIAWFKKAEAIKVPKYRAKLTRVLYKKLMESYDALNDQPNRRKYQKLYLDLEKKINDEEQNIAIHDIDVKYEVKEKEKQISALSGFKEKFENNRIIYSILLFLVFLLALYSFVRWRKVDINKKKLEKEKLTVQAEKLEIEEKHTKTVEELEKVKSIVIQDYITLKDKTKIYLNDLMYVKAEDHYLNACTKDGKKHFVRGKLSQLISELPPNFVKCHRSYIVNTNYIQATHSGHIILKNKEEIPVSRGFKWS